MSTRRYVDFKLYLTRPDPAKSACQVTLLPTPEVGESQGPVDVPAERGPDPQLLELLADKALTAKQLVTLGSSLADCLLPEGGEVRGLFKRAFDRARADGEGVRLRLIIADPALEAWPWEAVYLPLLGGPPSTRGFLVLSPHLSLIRHTPLPLQHPLRDGKGTGLETFKVVLIGASPSGAQSLDIQRDIDGVRAAVDGLVVDGKARFACAPAVLDATKADIEGALLHPKSAQIVHFSGHGGVGNELDGFTGVARRGYLSVLQDHQTKANARLSGESFARTLGRAEVQLAVLSACRTADAGGPDPWTGVAGALVAEGIPAVVAMQHKVLDAQAVDFAVAFYGALGAGLTLDEAMSIGRCAMVESGDFEEDKPYPTEWAVPVLYSRIGNGTLWPERSSDASKTAVDLRRFLSVTAEAIDKGASFVGVKVKRVQRGLVIREKFGTISGKVTGVTLGDVGDSANIDVEVDMGTLTKDSDTTAIEIDTA